MCTLVKKNISNFAHVIIFVKSFFFAVIPIVTNKFCWYANEYMNLKLHIIMCEPYKLYTHY